MFREFLCGLRTQHKSSLRHIDGNRMMLRCTSCGHLTPGWEASGRPPQRRYDGDAQRLTMLNPRVSNWSEQ